MLEMFLHGLGSISASRLFGVDGLGGCNWLVRWVQLCIGFWLHCPQSNSDSYSGVRIISVVEHYRWNGGTEPPARAGHNRRNG